MHPEARGAGRRGPLRAVALPGRPGQPALLAAPAPARLPGHGAPPRCAARGAARSSSRARSCSCPRAAHAARRMQEAGVDARALPLRPPPDAGRLRHPPAHRDPVQLHGARLGPARRPHDAAPEGRRGRVRRDDLRGQPPADHRHGAASASPTACTSSARASTPPTSRRRVNGDRRPGSPAGALRIVCVGTLHEVKGQRHLVEACRLLAGEGVDVAWPPRRRRRGPRDARGRDRGGRAGRAASSSPAPLTRDQVAAELAAADVLVAPSVPTQAGPPRGHPGRADGGDEQRAAGRRQPHLRASPSWCATR